MRRATISGEGAGARSAHGRSGDLEDDSDDNEAEGREKAGSQRVFTLNDIRRK